MEKENCSIIQCLKNWFGSEKLTNDYQYKIGSEISDVKPYFDKLALSTGLSLKELQEIDHFLPNVQPVYLVVTKQDKPILVAYFQIFTISYKNFNRLRPSGFFKRIVEFFLKFKRAKVLFLGNVLRTYKQSFLYDDDTLTHSQALELLNAAAEKIVTQNQITATVFKELRAGDENTMMSYGFSSPWEDMAMNMKIRPGWKTFEDYQKTLSRKYAARSKKIKASGKELIFKSLDIVEIEKYTNEIRSLFDQLLSRQPFVLSNPTISYFLHLKKLYGDMFEFYIGMYEDEPVGFYSAFVDKDSYELYYLGFDERLNDKLSIYFNILFYGLERAIVLQKEQLKLGRTSLDAKASMGAEAQKLPASIKISASHAWLMEVLVCYFMSNENSKWKERSPFKQIENPDKVEAFV